MNFIKGASYVVRFYVFSAEFCFECDRSFLGDDLDRKLAFGVAVKVEGFFYTRSRVLFTEIDDFLRSDKKGEVFLLFTSYFRELELGCDDWLNGFLTIITITTTVIAIILIIILISETTTVLVEYYPLVPIGIKMNTFHEQNEMPRKFFIQFNLS